MPGASDSDSEASLSTASSRAPSVDFAAAPTLNFDRGLADTVRGEPAEVTRLRLQREQKLRRMLSQRYLGQPEPVAHNAFFCTRNSLAEEDFIWLYALANHDCFERLLLEVSSTTWSFAGHLDAILSNANPFFHFNYCMPIEAPELVAPVSGPEKNTENDGDLRLSRLYLQESLLMVQWSGERCTIHRKRPALEDQDRPKDADKAKEEDTRRKSVKRTIGASASSGIVAQSMVAWEAHLTASLTKEGETIENFRQARSKSSYTEKKLFQQQAEWNEFAREVTLRQQQRDREATRALRRGEVNE